MIDKEGLKELIKKFKDDLGKGIALDDPETDTERLYIEPFLKILGWDISSREVKKSRLAGLSGKKTDYSFWSKRKPLFILEAKAVSVSLDGHYIEGEKKIFFPEKTIQYAWNTNTPVGVLFNFNELRIYNATVRVDTPERALLIRPIKYTEFLDRIEDLQILSKEWVNQGILYDKVRKQNIDQDMPIRQTIDKAILNQIVKWRKILLNHITEEYKHSALERKNLRNIVQLFLDRIIFIRVVEDLNLEKWDGLWSIITGIKKPYMEQIIKKFEYMDKFYNSMLFQKSLIDNIEISDDVLSSVIKDTYDFRFDKLPVDLFGSFYENYLGNIINEEKEIVKDKNLIKAKGIYYTAPQIVDLIISLTIKNKISRHFKKGKKPKIPELTILDPACGSGSFIMRAYDELMKYIHDGWEFKKDFEWKKDVLLNCIYGVDLDQQAVETASTYLLIGLLKDCVEKPLFLPFSVKDKKKIGSNESEMGENLPLFRNSYLEKRKQEYEIRNKMVKEGEFHLPTMMGENATIRCGNSLVSGPLSQLKKFFGNRIKEVKSFDWLKEYPDIFEEKKDQKGFDIIIGNPPYRNMDEPKEGDDKEFFEKEKKYFQEYSNSRNKFLPWHNYYRRMSDIYYFFFYRGISLLKEGGLLGYITSRSYLEAYYADILRQNILDTCLIKVIIDFKHIRVFEEPSITTAITILQKSTDKTIRKENIIKIVKVKKELEGYNFQDRMDLLTNHITENIDKEKYKDDYIEVFNKKQKELSSKPWYLSNEIDEAIFRKIDGNNLNLEEICEVGEGMQTGANKVFCNLTYEGIASKGLEESYIYKRATNSDIFPYYSKHGGKYGIYIEDIPSKGNSDLSNIPRNIKRWLIENKETLESRAAFERGDCLWFRYTWPLHKEYYKGMKIICPYRASENRFYLDEDQEYLCYTDTTVIFPKTSSKQTSITSFDIDLYYILGLLNSKLLEFRYKGIGKLTGKDTREYFGKQIGKLPIKLPDKQDEKEMSIYNEIIQHTKNIQKLYTEAFSLPKTFKKRDEKIKEAIELIEVVDKKVEEIYGVYL
ncbi:Eco57I restriction-modification methylase domain-containing protein [Thermodesulfobacteriota bacterium]